MVRKLLQHSLHLQLTLLHRLLKTLFKRVLLLEQRLRVFCYFVVNFGAERTTYSERTICCLLRSVGLALHLLQLQAQLIDLFRLCPKQRLLVAKLLLHFLLQAIEDLRLLLQLRLLSA